MKTSAHIASFSLAALALITQEVHCDSLSSSPAESSLTATPLPSPKPQPQAGEPIGPEATSWIPFRVSLGLQRKLTIQLQTGNR